jgi:3-deoxy-7-phosphoheptulonate synthase
VILRGGQSGPNYSPESVAEVADKLEASGLTGHLMIDCSHANSGKRHDKQPDVARAVADQVAGGSRKIFGVMLESFLVDGRQNHDDTVRGGGSLVRGQSITDACMSWERTVPVLEGLAEAVRKRRG